MGTVLQKVFDARIAQEVAKLLIQIEAVTFSFDLPYSFTSGIKSPIYLDNRIVMSYPRVRDRVVEFYVEAIQEKVGFENVDWISATATAAIPQGALVADRLALPLVYVRPETKEYGKGSKIEGFVKEGSRVLIIEDHISTGTSAINNTKTIRAAGGKVEFCVATTTYETEKAETKFKKNHLKSVPLTTGKIIVETALREGRLTKTEKESVDLWFSDPLHWAEKVGLE
jgi:orotate phosphoribosyltransferase